MASENHDCSATSAVKAQYNNTGSLHRPEVVHRLNHNEQSLAQKHLLLEKTARLHAVQSLPSSYNNVLSCAETAMFMDEKWIATSALVGSGDFNHTVTPQWLNSITEGSPDGKSQESVIGSEGDKNENLVGLGIRHISESRFNYALSANPSSDFLGNRTPVGLGIGEISSNCFEYALSANPYADFVGDGPSIGLGIRYLSNSNSEFALSAHPCSVLAGREKPFNAHYVIIKGSGPAFNASQPPSIKKPEKSIVVNTISPQISAESMVCFTERHLLNMSCKNKSDDKKDWFPYGNEDLMACARNARR